MSQVDMGVKMLEWTDMVTHRVNATVAALEGLSQLHSEVEWLGTVYCNTCKVAWPCASAEVFTKMRSDLGGIE